MERREILKLGLAGISTMVFAKKAFAFDSDPKPSDEKRGTATMSKSKYEEYFITQCSSPLPEKMRDVSSGNFSMNKANDLFPKSGITGSGVCFVKPWVMVDNTHIHDCDEFLYFMGANFADPDEFDAEIELYMGEEGEKRVITAPTIVYIPAGLVHCPLKFVKVNKPVLFFHVRDHNTG